VTSSVRHDVERWLILLRKLEVPVDALRNAAAKQFPLASAFREAVEEKPDESTAESKEEKE
jgi:hypothetical protein